MFAIISAFRNAIFISRNAFTLTINKPKLFNTSYKHSAAL